MWKEFSHCSGNHFHTQLGMLAGPGLWLKKAAKILPDTYWYCAAKYLKFSILQMGRRNRLVHHSDGSTSAQ